MTDSTKQEIREILERYFRDRESFPSNNEDGEDWQIDVINREAIEALSQLIEREKSLAYAEGANLFNAVEYNGILYPKGAIRMLNKDVRAKWRRK